MPKVVSQFDFKNVSHKDTPIARNLFVIFVPLWESNGKDPNCSGPSPDCRLLAKKINIPDSAYTNPALHLTVFAVQDR